MPQLTDELHESVDKLIRSWISSKSADKIQCAEELDWLLYEFEGIELKPKGDD